MHRFPKSNVILNGLPNDSRNLVLNYQYISILSGSRSMRTLKKSKYFYKGFNLRLFLLAIILKLLAYLPSHKPPYSQLKDKLKE